MAIDSKTNYVYECFSLPKDIKEVTLDGDALRSEIKFAMKNLDGYRSGMFIPYMAFENLAKTQIERLELPVIKSIHSVVEQLLSAVKISTQHVSNIFSLTVTYNLNGISIQLKVTFLSFPF